MIEKLERMLKILENEGGDFDLCEYCVSKKECKQKVRPNSREVSVDFCSEWEDEE